MKEAGTRRGQMLEGTTKEGEASIFIYLTWSTFVVGHEVGGFVYHLFRFLNYQRGKIRELTCGLLLALFKEIWGWCSCKIWARGLAVNLDIWCPRVPPPLLALPGTLTIVKSFHAFFFLSRHIEPPLPHDLPCAQLCNSGDLLRKNALRVLGS